MYPMVSQPQNLPKNLYNHQLTSIYYMEERERTNISKLPDSRGELKTNVGVFSDITGYGKTLSMIGLLLRDKMEWDMSVPYKKESIDICADEYIIKTVIKTYTKIDVTLIVANTPILNQWKREIDLTNINYAMVSSKKILNTIEIEDYDVILCLPTMFNHLTSNYKDISWKRIIIDEPETISTKLQKVIAGFFWFITATPKRFISSSANRTPTHLYNIFKKIITFHSYSSRTDFFDGIIVKNDEEYVKKSFVIPETFYKSYYCYNKIYSICRGMISEDVLDMISAGDIKRAVMYLGGEETGNITELVEKKLESKLHKIDETVRKLELKNKIDDKKIKSLLSVREKISLQIDELSERFTTSLKDPCNICMGPLKKPVLVSCCQNIFCGECVFEWLKNNKNCPLCRTDINQGDFVYIKTDSNDTEEIPKKTDMIITKSETLVKILKENESKENKKSIIFSQYNQTNVETILKNNGINYNDLKGVSDAKERKLNEFRSGKTPILFLNSSENGAGLNLQETTDIILYHAMSEDLETQIIGRANRIGRKTSLTVHKLMNKL